MINEVRPDEGESPQGGTTRLWGLVIAAVLVVAAGWFVEQDTTTDIYESVPQAFVPAAEHRLPPPAPAVPVFVLRKEEAFTASALRRLERTTGVAAVAPVTIARRTVARAGEHRDVVWVGLVDPLSFRDVAPPAMRDADFVWTALIAGEAVVTHEVAKKLDLGTDPNIQLAGGTETSVGAIANNGTPNLAGVLVSNERFEPNPNKVFHLAIVGAESGVQIPALRDDLKRRLPGMRLEGLLPEAQRVAPRVQVVAANAELSPSTGVPIATGLHPVLAESVERLVSASVGRVWVVSGYRSSQHQYALWVSALQRYRTPEEARHWVAPPGYSAHERGLAVDLGGDLALAVRLIEELRLPLWRPMTWEPWHFELVGSRG